MESILITGATGYLGSVLCVDLCRDHQVTGLFRRPPSKRLSDAAPGVRWEKGDVAEPGCLECIFRRCANRGAPIHYVIHFAAYTDYGARWRDEYSNTNVIGTRNIIEAAADAGVKRILFASSIAALDPGPPGTVLTEQSVRYSDIAYPKSKALGEQLLFEHSDQVPVVVLRIGGVFTHWCELPPLFSVMRVWSQPFVGRMMPGKGDSGFPYIHRKDVVTIVRKILEKDDRLSRYEVLFGAHAGCTLQKEIFPIVRQACSRYFSTTPIHVPRFPAKMVLHAKYLLNAVIRKRTYERAWMIDYVDRPLVVDTLYTRSTLGWEPSAERHIVRQMPFLMDNFCRHRKTWLRRNIDRNDQNYKYYPD